MSAHPAPAGLRRSPRRARKPQRLKATSTDMSVDSSLDAAVQSVLATLAFDLNRSPAMAREVRRVRQATPRMIVELGTT